MRKELQEIENIENYLMGKMSESKKAEFEKRMKADSTLQQNVEIQKGLVAGLERIGLKNDMLKAKRSLFMRKVWTWFGVGVLLAGLGWFSVQYFSADVNQTETEIIESATDEKSKIKDESLVDEGLLDEGLKIKVERGFSASLEDLSKGFEINEQNLVGQRESLTADNDKADLNLDQFESAQIPIKKFQTFKIDPTKANSITGKEGTIIEFPANAFQTESDEEVTIQLKEFYKLSDIVFANLTTQTKEGELIETGGMVQIEASQPSKAKLELMPDKSITLKFPSTTSKEGMKTFLGEEDAFGNVVWAEEDQELEIVDVQNNVSSTLVTPGLDFESVKIFTIVEDMPVFKGCEGLTSRSLKEKCTNEKMIEYLNKNAKFPSYNSKLSGKNGVLVQFKINERGLVFDVTVVKSTAPKLNKYAIAAVKSMPRFTPGKQRGIPVRVQYTIPVTYNVTEGSPNALNERESQRYLAEMNKKSQEDIEEALDNTLEDSTISAVDQLSIAQGYVLSSANLGWINCDRYPLAQNGKSSFNVFEKDQRINCSLILHSVRGIVSPRYIKQGKYIFPQLPNEEKVTVLAFKNENNKNYVSYELTTHDKSDHTFNFEPLTKERLQQITQELDAINN